MHLHACTITSMTPDKDDEESNRNVNESDGSPKVLTTAAGG